MKTISFGLFGLVLGFSVLGLSPAAAEDDAAGPSVAVEQDMRESRAAVVAGLDRIAEQGMLEYGEIRLSRELSERDDAEESTGSCTIDVTVRTQEFDGLTMSATASTCAKASDMVIEGVEALVV